MTTATVLARHLRRQPIRDADTRAASIKKINADVTRQLMDCGTERALKETLVLAQRDYDAGFGVHSCIHRAVRRVRSGSVK